MTIRILLGSRVCALGSSAANASTLAEIKQFWVDRDYPRVITELLAFRDDIFGRNVEVDYLLATSLCRNPGDEDLGEQFFQHILQRYQLSEANRVTVENERRQCRTPTQPVQIAFLTNRSTGGGDAGVRGKMFYWIGGQNRAIGGDPLEAVMEIPQQELAARLFNQDQAAEAVAAMQQRLGNRARVHAATHFVLGSLSDHADSDLHYIAGLLESALQFEVQSFDIRPPQSLISVYLVPDAWSLRKQGEKLHGLKVGEGAIGYSFQNDLSLSAVVTGPNVGTLKHELTHLLVRTYFGDAPPWLDEGLAALYEVSRQEGDFLRGLPNWRGEVLQRYWRGEPGIAELLGMNWAQFDAEHRSMKQQAVNHALARYWILYLQDNDLLEAVYRAIRDQKVSRLSGNASADMISLTENAAGRSFARLESEFNQWLQDLNRALSNAEVKLIQQRLTELGYAPGPVDGLIGSKTIRAVKKFQAENGLAVDGKLDANLIRVLQNGNNNPL